MNKNEIYYIKYNIDKKDGVIMQLSKFSDYSFRALIYLSKHQSQLCTVEKLAQELKTSEHHMKKIIHYLAKTDYIISVKGRSGGVKLGTKPENINLGEILKITEENLNIIQCFGNKEECPFMGKGCRLKEISVQALNSFVQEFSKYTLQDLLEEKSCNTL